MTETADAAITVRRADAENRYEIRVDGELAGFTAYRDRGEQRVFYHTEIAEAFGGRGLSGVLVGQALTDVRESGRTAVPVCPLVAAYLRKHPEYADIARPVEPAILKWLDTELG
ncbi:GNAT family N-acetyltransferase [Amycolatopsis cynarae]|uniref:GNAT family N-acetyltransferase n=1 Tax=Amycolatopsis cynarae TaxID=2995223 RepID=A0ABY7ATH0_9PSEU|nr:GNAT family N-acetyltransferase [Amycolatopsis sp. HUAS 11-8]WAL63259.1 GNAT family N-acetyltransferase [Amycolatopsis sp. HUAS 11-8]